MIDNVVVPVASGFGLAEDYKYLKISIREFLTGAFILINIASCFLLFILVTN